MTGPSFIDRLDLAGYYLCRIAVGFVWQSLVIVIVALCVATLARKRRAGERYVMWMGAVSLMCVIAVMPFWVMLIDSVRVSLPMVPRYVAPHLTLAVGAKDGMRLFLVALADNNGMAAVLLLKACALAADLFATRFWAMTMFVLMGVYTYIWCRARRRYACLKRILWQARILNGGRIVRIFKRAADDLALDRYYVICEHDGIATPFTVDEYHPGVRMVRGYMDIRTGRDLPVIVVPSRLVRDADDETLYKFALHELSHVRNYDAAVIRALTFFRRVFFFNPCAVFVTRFIGTLIEESADDDVIDVTGQPLDYARMLYRVAADSLGQPVLVSGSAALFLTKRSLLRRIKRILAVRPNRSKSSAWIRTALTATAVAVSLWFVYLFPVTDSWDRMTITGTASVDGRVYAECPVYVLWNRPSHLKRIAVTDETGRFTCTVPDRKISGQVLNPPRFFLLDNKDIRCPNSIPAKALQGDSFIPMTLNSIGYSH